MQRQTGTLAASSSASHVQDRGACASVARWCCSRVRILLTTIIFCLKLVVARWGLIPTTCGSCWRHEHTTNLANGVSRQPVLDYGTTFHPGCDGRDSPSILLDDLWKHIFWQLKRLVTLSTYRRYINNCIYLSIYLQKAATATHFSSVTPHTKCNYKLHNHFMVALWNRADHYIFALWFLLLSSSSFFFPHLISAVGDWMSAILTHTAWPQCEFRMQIWNVLRAARRYSPTNLSDGAQMANFWRFCACCIFSEPRAAHFRPAF